MVDERRQALLGAAGTVILPYAIILGIALSFLIGPLGLALAGVGAAAAHTLVARGQDVFSSESDFDRIVPIYPRRLARIAKYLGVNVRVFSGAVWLGWCIVGLSFATLVVLSVISFATGSGSGGG